MKFAGKVVVVTGAGSGIGRACAIHFAGLQAIVVVADLNQTGALETVEQINAKNGKAISYELDVADPVAVHQFADWVFEKYSRIDVLVNNAAIQVNKTIEDTSIEEWNRQISVNLGGMFLCSKYFLPMLRKIKGNIVNMSSVNAYYVEPGCAGYCATKAAIIGLTKAMAIDHGQEGVRVNCVCPGYIDAGLAQGYFDAQGNPHEARMAAGKLHALHRIGLPEEVAKAVGFLASEDASFITGTAMAVDGGFGSGMAPASR